MNSSRITLHALVFAVLSTASLAFATQVQRHDLASAAPAEPMQVFVLPTVQITGHRMR